MPPRVARLEYKSLADLYEHYVREYVARSPIVASCGCVIHCYEHHFVHVVKLFGPGKTRIYFPDEKQLILATRVGFGHYEHETRRATRLLASLDCLRNPDKVVRPDKLETADRAFIKEFECSQYPYIVVLVRKDDGHLTLCTGQPIRRTDQKLAGWRTVVPKNTSATREGGCVTTSGDLTRDLFVLLSTAKIIGQSHHHVKRNPQRCAACKLLIPLWL